MTMFSVVQIERDDFSSPIIKFVEAVDDQEAFVKFAELVGCTAEELEEGEEDGDIYIAINECIISEEE